MYISFIRPYFINVLRMFSQENSWNREFIHDTNGELCYNLYANIYKNRKSKLITIEKIIMI